MTDATAVRKNSQSAIRESETGRVGRKSGSATGGAPLDAGECLHVEEERGGAATLRQMPLALLGVLFGFLAILAPDSEG